MTIKDSDITPVDGKPHIKVYADDDLVTRAEKIVWSMNIRGSAGDYIIAVYRILQAYDILDRETGKTNAASPQK